MAEGRRVRPSNEDPPDPWAHLARIEASVNATLTGAEQPAPDSSADPSDDTAADSPAQPLRRDRAALRAPSADSSRDAPFPVPRRSTPPAAAPGREPGRRAAILATAGVLVLLLVGVWIGVDTRSHRGEPVRSLDGQANSATPQPVPSSTASSTQSPNPSPAATSAVSAAWAARVKLGVFRGTSRSQISGFESWLGRDVDYIVDFSSRDTWDEIANPHYMIDEWAGSRYRVVYSTGLLPNTGHSTIALGAKGNYDTHFRRLAQNLVNAGENDAIIRLGWEFNLGSSAWSTNKPADFISYWRHVVQSMRSVHGQHFQFDWNPNVGDTTYDATLYYPGNAYVDFVGVDVYDLSWQVDTYPYPASCAYSCQLLRQKTVWDRLYYGQHGLGFWAQFAASKHKPMSLPEWGVWKRDDNHGGGDDPYFIDQMYRFIATPANNVAYQAYFETNTSDGQHRLMTTMPNAGKIFRKLFG